MTENQTTTAPAAKTAKAVTTKRCTCGCGEATSSSKTMYKPGHDARHAGNVARQIVAEGNDTALNQLPTANLQYKAKTMAARLVAKAEAKASKPVRQTAGSKRAEALIVGLTEDLTKAGAVVAQEEAAHAEETATEVPEPMWEDEAPAGFPGEVKVGRWSYPARYDANTQTTLRNTKRDGSGEWVPYEG